MATWTSSTILMSMLSSCTCSAT
uniref:Uncharacterized protein n=1 Tax=Anguilla anguilla TaxID=7936 RepID=A0A0E9TQD3_ANGAN